MNDLATKRVVWNGVAADVRLGGRHDQTVNAVIDATLATADDLCVRPLPGLGERC